MHEEGLATPQGVTELRHGFAAFQAGGFHVSE